MIFILGTFFALIAATVIVGARYLGEGW